jgi:type IV pilus assembly protein PilA
MRVRFHGFSLIELMVVIAIIAFLSMISMPSFFKFLAKAKRAEAYITLRSLHMAEKAYWHEHGTYTKRLFSEGLNWKPEGVLQYTYGFNGGGDTAVVGDLKAPSSALAGSHAGKDSFTIAAAADIDGDGDLDIITINQDGYIKITQDDLS